MHTPSEKKSDDSKDSCCVELEQVSDRFPQKYHMKIMLGDLNANVGRERIFSDGQLGIAVNVRIVMIIVSE